MAWSLRRPDPSDAEALIALVQASFEGYRAIGPPGWEPPDEWERLEFTRAELARPETFALAAWDGDILAGHVRWVPLGDPVDIHFRSLFVAESHWGTGVARELHAAAVDAMDGRSARLFTPARQARARRFYEREGWTLVADLDDEHFGMPLAEYRR